MIEYSKICILLGNPFLLYLKGSNMEKQFMLLSEFVRQKRKYLKMTQIEMSEKSGVGIRFIREL